jgi:hypothetical protein
VVGDDVVGHGGNAVVACEPTVTKARFDSLASIAAIGSLRPMEFELLYVAPATALGRFVGLDNVDIKKRGLCRVLFIRPSL